MCPAGRRRDRELGGGDVAPQSRRTTWDHKEEVGRPEQPSEGIQSSQGIYDWCGQERGTGRSPCWGTGSLNHW